MPYSSGPTWLVAAVLALTAAGCHTPQGPETNRAAAVMIKDRSAIQITDATKAVFTRHAYEAARAEDDEMVFQKPGTFMNALVHGDWYSGAVWERVKIYQRNLSPTQTVLEGDIYMVQQPEDPLFQKEQKLTGHKNRLQKLLEEVPAELDQTPGKSP